MALDALGNTQTATDTLSQSSVSQNDLFKILLTQLKYQDPLKPTDNAEFIAQLAQFTSLDQSRQTNENIQSLLQLEATNQSVGLIGKTVEISSSSSDTASVGEVTTISFDQGTPMLTVKTSDGSELTGISLSEVKTIR
jgi:flagellar basal-body rod modification protein FlgD